jgi:hypothetical protein
MDPKGTLEFAIAVRPAVYTGTSHNLIYKQARISARSNCVSLWTDLVSH